MAWPLPCCTPLDKGCPAVYNDNNLQRGRCSQHQPRFKPNTDNAHLVDLQD